MQALPNGGILFNDTLDKLRSDALIAVSAKGLPEPVVYYLRGLESAYLDMKLQQHRDSLREVRWKFEGEP